MPCKAPRWAAWCALGLLTVLALCLFLDPAQAQLGGRPRPGFGPPIPVPPINPPRIPGMPGGPAGPGMPPLGPGIPTFENVWTCSKCGKELGRGKTLAEKPNYTQCPFCGAHFINGGGFGAAPLNPGPGLGLPNQPNPTLPNGPQVPNPVVPNGPQATNPALPNLPTVGPAGPSAANPPAASSSSTSDTEVSPGSARKIGIGIGIVVAAVVLVGLAVFVIVNGSSGGSGKKRRRRARDDYYDD